MSDGRRAASSPQAIQGLPGWRQSYPDAVATAVTSSVPPGRVRATRRIATIGWVTLSWLDGDR